MASSGSVSEIIEHVEVHEQVYNLDKSIASISNSKEDETDQRSFQLPVDNELDWILNSIDRNISRTMVPSHQKAAVFLQNCKKKRIGISHPSGIGISESVNLKQALRRLCISQAAEVASMKRLSLPCGSCSASEAETIEKLYVSMVLQVKKAASSAEEGRQNVMEASIVPERNSASTIVMEQTTQNQGILASEPSEPAESSSAVEVIGIKGDVVLKTCVFDSKTSVKLGKTRMRLRPSKPVFRRKCCTTRKVKHGHVGKSGTSVESSETEVIGPLPIKTKMSCLKGFVSPACSNANTDAPRKTKGASNVDNKLDVGQTSCINGKATRVKVIETSSSREKGECSQSSKSSICDYSSSNSISDDSHQSISDRNSSRPHMSKDVRWVAIRNVVKLHGGLDLKNFRLLKMLGYGDIGTVYLSELTGSDCLYALKVMDIDFLLSKKKMSRAQTEREILQMLDHPFLPTLYAHFTSDNLSCLVVEYCPGGDLHVLRQKQIGRCFSESAVRFYVAEVLLALEYLHMLGVIYRDLKPENILVREDGHIMLSDFDLSLRCKVNPILLKSSSSSSPETVKKLSRSCAENSCIDPLCLHHSWAPVSCFRPQLASSSMPSNRKLKSDLAGHVFPLPQLVAEPTDARSNSFVGTHEYLAPEIIRGDGHGSAVDWWTFGIFFYELLFSRTPFKGSSNEVTMTNVVIQSLKFPEIPSVSFHAKDLIKCLLVKEPENRIGSARGAAEIKQHPFFEGLNWALIRCSEPPELPGSYEARTPPVLRKKREFKCLDFRSNAGDLEFETF